MPCCQLSSISHVVFTFFTTFICNSVFEFLALLIQNALNSRDIDRHDSLWCWSLVQCCCAPGGIDQGRSKVFTTGQARVDLEHYVIKYVGGR